MLSYKPVTIQENPTNNPMKIST